MIFYLSDLLIKEPQLFLMAIIVLILPLLVSIAIHEAAHGFVAYKFGDPTPKITGRLTLNPFKHLDLLGTILLFTIGIGWAKPVLINPLNINNKTKEMLVALAGPLSNFLLGFIFILLTVFMVKYTPPTSFNRFIVEMFNNVVKINFILAFFNLIPIPPLDGSRIVSWLLPDGIKEKYNSIEPYGIFIFMLIMMTIGFGFIFNIAKSFQLLIYSFLGI